MSADRDHEADKARTTIDEAREEGQGSPGRGDAPVVPDYADDDGQAFRGVDEPTVPPDHRGEEAVENEERGVV